MKKIAEDNHQAWISAFKKSIRPLDDATVLIEDEKEKMQNKIDETQILIEWSISEKEARV